MIGSFSNVKIDAILGAAGKHLLNVDDICTNILKLDERQKKRLVKSLGFKNLRQLELPYTIGDLAVSSLKHFFLQTKEDPKAVDALIFVTQTPDFLIPGVSYKIQSELGFSEETLLLDFTQGCSGFVYAMFYAANLLSSGVCKKVLVCAGDTACMTVHDLKYIETAQSNNYALFGDGLGIALLSRDDNASNLFFSIKSHGDKYKTVFSPNFGYTTLRSVNFNEADLNINNAIDGVGLVEYISDTVVPDILRLLKKNSLEYSDLSYIIAHQANKNLIKLLATLIEKDESFVPFLAENTGNTSSASIALALSEGKNNLSLIKEKPAVLTGFGVGLSCATCIVNLKDTVICDPFYM